MGKEGLGGLNHTPSDEGAEDKENGKPEGKKKNNRR
jgi:hypothetical protein